MSKMSHYILVFVLFISTYWMQTNAYPKEYNQENKKYSATRNNRPYDAEVKEPSNSLESDEIVPETNPNSDENDEDITGSVSDSEEYASKNDDDDDLETADSIVFRPLFSYRARMAQRRRYYGKPTYVNRRTEIHRPMRPIYFDRPFPHVP